MAIKLWPVEGLLLARLHEPMMSTMADRSLSSLEPERHPEECRHCGHVRSLHPGGYPDHVWDTCIATVLTPVGEFLTRPCECREYEGDDGTWAWSAGGQPR